jgi:hypothetical protein
VGGVVDGEYDVDERLGDEAGDRGRADVRESLDAVAERRADAPGLALEQPRPVRVVGDESHGTVETLDRPDPDGRHLLLVGVAICAAHRRSLAPVAVERGAQHIRRGVGHACGRASDSTAGRSPISPLGTGEDADSRSIARHLMQELDAPG